VTRELVAAADEAQAAAIATIRAQRENAITALRAIVERGAKPNRTTAEAVLMDHKLTRKEARAVLADGEGTDWRTDLRADLPGQPRVLMPVGGVPKPAAEIPPPENPDATRAIEGHFRRPLETLGRRECHEISQMAQGLSEGGISAADSGLPLAVFGRGPGLEPNIPLPTEGAEPDEEDPDPEELARAGMREGA